MKKWEYLTVGGVPATKQISDERMNALGADGWELVSAIVSLNGQGVVFFKRPVLEPSDYKETGR